MVQGKEKTMNDIKEVIIQLRKKSSVRKINRDLHIHRPIVRVIRDAAEARGWLNPNTMLPSDHEIAQLEISKKCKGIQHPLDAFAEDIKQWREEGINAVVIQRLLQQKHSQFYAIGTLRRYIKKVCPTLPDPIMIRSTIPGEVMDVDFGFLGKIWDESTNKLRKVWIFSARLRHSRKAYREMVWKQDVRTFSLCHIHAFEHFNGVPQKVVLDNLKAGIIKSCVDNDMINRSYRDLAEHYSFMISPCLPYTPEHKGGVENDIKYIKGNFWPQLKERLKIYPQLNLQEANEELRKWDREVADVRKIHGIGRTPKDIFIEEESSKLNPLPAVRWEPTEWLKYLVGRDWAIRFDGSLYSVPYMFISQTVYVRVTSQFLKVFFDNQEITQHPRAIVKGTFQRNPLHAPPFKEVVLKSNRRGLLMQAEEVGPNVRAFCDKMFADKFSDKLRPVRNLLSLALRYDKSRIDKACERALKYNTIRYASVKDILERGLDLESSKIEPLPGPQMNFKYARNFSEYQSG